MCSELLESELAYPHVSMSCPDLTPVTTTHTDTAGTYQEDTMLYISRMLARNPQITVAATNLSPQGCCWAFDASLRWLYFRSKDQ